ncbi:DnaJ domain-containing protein, partial [Candidatus Gribaldobacteria bacterium]|nr:DnaJ domain-containing protein [Candidatus Gribaldobacteria bacterium]
RPLGATNSNLPKEWFEPNPIDFRGTAINLSHPAKVAYFKLHTPDQIGPDGKQRRKYDLEDIEKLVEIGQLSLKEIERIDLILGIESNIQLTKGKRLLRPVLEKITEEMSGEAIFQAFTKEDWAQERFRSDKDGGFAKRLRDFSEEVAKMSDKSLEGIFQKLEERYYRDSDNLFLNKIVKLKKQAKHRDDIEKVRASFDKITKRDDDVNEKQKKETANLSGNAYEILGVSEESSDEEIKAAFRKKIKHFHPDRLPDRRKEGYDYTEEFLGQAAQKIKSAYESIKNEEARIVYKEEKSGGLSEKDWQWLKWLAPQAYARKKAKEEEAIREAQRKRDMRERETREEERKRTAPERRAQRLAEERIQRQIKQKEAAQAEAEKMNKINQPETDENIQGREWRKVFKKEIEDLSRDVADLKKQLRELYSYKEMPRGSSGRYYIDLLVKANEQAEDIERQEKEFFDRAHSYFYEKYKGNVDNDAVGKEENTDRTSFFADLTKDITRCQLTILEIRIKLGIHSRFFEEK